LVGRTINVDVLPKRKIAILKSMIIWLIFVGMDSSRW
jgi:hypothetical protein